MAGAGAPDMAKVEKCMKNYLESTAADKNSIKGNQLAKCFDACGLSPYKSTMDASVFPKYCDKAKKCTIKDCATKVIDDIAAIEVGKKRPGGKKAPVDDDEVKALANDIRNKIAIKADASPDGKKAVKVDKATARLTDTSKYTGAHKERFDESGKGKGIDGRADTTKNTGYVGNYKGDGTFDKK